jgi:hypothetical protein
MTIKFYQQKIEIANFSTILYWNCKQSVAVNKSVTGLKNDIEMKTIIS